MLDLLLAWILGLQQACLRFPEWSIPNRWLLLFDSVIGTTVVLLILAGMCGRAWELHPMPLILVSPTPSVTLYMGINYHLR
jgi:hypothetical protein